MDPLLITTQVDLTGVNTLTPAVTSAMSQIRSSTATATAGMLEFKSSTTGAAAAAAQLGESGAELSPIVAVMETLVEAIGKLTARMDSIPVHAKAAAEESASAFSLLEEKIVGTAEAAHLSATGIGSAFSGLSALLGGGLLVGFLAHFIDEAKQAALEVGHLSERTGLSIETVAGLQVETERLGLGLEAVSTGMIRLERAQGLALDGHAAQAKAFHDLGISMKELSSLSPEEVLNRVSGAIQQTENQSTRASSAITLFGRGGAALIPIFTEYGNTLAQASHETGALSGVTEEAVQLSFEWQRAQTDISVAMRKLALEALPSLTEGLHLATTAISLWNQESESGASAANRQGSIMGELRRELALTSESYGYLAIKAQQYYSDLTAVRDTQGPTSNIWQAFKDNAALADLQVKDLKKDTAEALGEAPKETPAPTYGPIPYKPGQSYTTAGAAAGGKGGGAGEEGDAEAQAAAEEAREQEKFEHLKEFAEAEFITKTKAAQQAYEHNQITSEQELQQLRTAEDQKNQIILSGLESQKSALTKSLGDYASPDKLAAINDQINAITQKGKTETIEIEANANKQSVKEFLASQQERIDTLKASDTTTVQEVASNAAQVVAIQRQSLQALEAVNKEGATFGTREQIHGQADAVLNAVKELNAAIKRENEQAAAEQIAIAETLAKQQLKIIEESAKQQETLLAEDTKNRQAVQSETYKAQTAQPFQAPSQKIDEAQQNAAVLTSIAQDSAEQQTAIVQQSAQRQLTVLQSLMPVYATQFNAGDISAETYAKKVSEVMSQISSLSENTSTRQVQIIAQEASEETRIWQQELATFQQIQLQEEQAITQLVSSSTSALNGFLVTIGTTVGEVNGKISETRYIEQEFNRAFLQIERDFFQMILKMLEDTKLFKGVESIITEAFQKAFSIIPGLETATPKVPSPFTPSPAGGYGVPFGPTPGQGGVATVAGNQAAITSGPQEANTAQLGANTNALLQLNATLLRGSGATAATAPSTSVTPSAIATTSAAPVQLPAASADTSQQTAASASLTQFSGALNTATASVTENHTATITNTAATQTSTSATTSETTAAHGLTAAQVTQTPAVHATTVAQATQPPAVAATTAAQAAQAPAVHSSTAAHILHAIHVAASSVAHTIHQAVTHGDTSAQAINTAAKTINTAAIVPDTVAITSHATAAAADTTAEVADTAATYADVAAKYVYAFDQGGIIPATGLVFAHEGERVLTQEERATYEKSVKSAGGQVSSAALPQPSINQPQGGSVTVAPGATGAGSTASQETTELRSSISALQTFNSAILRSSTELAVSAASMERQIATVNTATESMQREISTSATLSQSAQFTSSTLDRINASSQTVSAAFNTATESTIRDSAMVDLATASVQREATATDSATVTKQSTSLSSTEAVVSKSATSISNFASSLERLTFATTSQVPATGAVTSSQLSMIPVLAAVSAAHSVQTPLILTETAARATEIQVIAGNSGAVTSNSASHAVNMGIVNSATTSQLANTNALSSSSTAHQVNTATVGANTTTVALNSTAHTINSAMETANSSAESVNTAMRTINSASLQMGTSQAISNTAAHALNTSSIANSTAMTQIATAAKNLETITTRSHTEATQADTQAQITDRTAVRSYETGGVIPSTGLIMAHEGERMLNVAERAEYESHLAGNYASVGSPFAGDSGGGGGGAPDTGGISNHEFNLHYHAGSVSALDGTGVDDILKKNRKAVEGLFHEAIKRGAISPRQLLAGKH